MDDRATREAAADLIDGAIDIIHERGWCQNTNRNADGQICAETSLGIASVDKTRAEGEMALAAVTRATGMSAWRFNDREDTTFEDVVLTMKRAAHSLREVTA